MRAAIGILALAAGLATVGGQDTPPGDLARGLGILEYLVGDYAEAVGDDGRLIDQFELDEQLGLLGEVEAIVRAQPHRMTRALVRELRLTRKEMRSRRPPREVVPELRRLHTTIVHEYGVQLAPTTVPSIVVGRIAYATSCAICHGDDGRGNTLLARELKPPPRDFLDPEKAATMSPYSVFAAVTWGIPGTGMASFETLSEDERWSLAFYVLALRQGEPAAADVIATPALGGATAVPGLTIRDLAFATDSDLRARAASLPEDACEAQIARWRWSPPFDIE
jgi:high-affinity iron transporter